MGVLNEVLKWKQYKDEQQAQSANAIPQAVAAFIQGRQQAESNQMKMLSVQAELAGKGFKLTPQGIMRDESLTSPLEQLVSQAKAAEAAKTMGNRTLWGALTGQPTQQAVAPVPSQDAPQAPSGIDQMQAPEIDQFTGKPTTAGVQQEAINKQIEAKGLESAKTEAKNAEKVKGMEAIEGDLNSLLSLYKEIPAGLKGPIEGRTMGVGAKMLGLNTALTTYEDSRGLVLANISREFGGEKGVLTDRDIKRIEDAFPNKTDTEAIAEKKIAFIRDFVGRKIEVKTKGARKQESTDLSSLSDEELKKLAGV
jgi:hypothetical protein